MDNKIAGKPLETLKTMQCRTEEDGIIAWSWASWVSSNTIVTPPSRTILLIINDGVKNNRGQIKIQVQDKLH